MRRAFAIVAAAVAVSAFCWAASLAGAAATRSGYSLWPNHGIGPVSIGERKSRVERALGQPPGDCQPEPGPASLCTYDRSRGNLTVAYDHGRVSDVGSSSGQITLGGIPLRRGPKHLRKQLQGWRHFKCYGWRIYEHGGLPGASIYFGYGGVQIDVSSQGQGGCGGQ